MTIDEGSIGVAHPNHRIACVAARAVSLFVLGCDSGREAAPDGAASPDVPPAEVSADVVASDVVATADVAIDAPTSDGLAADGAIEVVLPPGAVRVVLESGPIFGGFGQGYDISTNRVLESENGVCSADADFCALSRQIMLSAWNHGMRGRGSWFGIETECSPLGW